MKKVFLLLLILLPFFSFTGFAHNEYKPKSVDGEIDVSNPKRIMISWRNPEAFINAINTGVLKNPKLNIDYKIDNGKFLSEQGKSPIVLDIYANSYIMEPFINLNDMDAFNSRLTIKLYYSYDLNSENKASDLSETISLGHNNEVFGGRSWSKNYVTKANNLGILQDSMKADIGLPINRLEFIKMLMKLDSHIAKRKINRVYSFNDTADTDVTNALNLGIITGDRKNNFNSSSSLTKEAMVVIIYRYLNLLNKLETKSRKDTKVTFVSPVSDWAVKAYDKLISLGIIEGDENNRINPKDSVSREQAIVMVVRLLEI
ncbi:MAG: S-layer homology domain-containing protein [Ezakiella sp.]|nr:S-layer homology domain-containing protein [Ezakiella sp.]MDD7471844.1 S-layer homology domain-containing protein [Bacillota bacterium]MDY3923808.1 S-layer homology domain-containing protein [Ezakiella sp.]